MSGCSWANPPARDCARAVSTVLFYGILVSAVSTGNARAPINSGFSCMLIMSRAGRYEVDPVAQLGVEVRVDLGDGRGLLGRCRCGIVGDAVPNHAGASQDDGSHDQPAKPANEAMDFVFWAWSYDDRWSLGYLWHGTSFPSNHASPA